MLMQEYIHAAQGAVIWRRLNAKKSAGKQFFAVFPEHNALYNYYGVRCIEPFVKNHQYNEIVVVTADALVAKATSELFKNAASVQIINQTQMDRLLRFFSFHVDFLGTFTIKNVRVVSTLFLQGRLLNTLAECKVFPPEHLVWKRMYHNQGKNATELALAPYIYTGDDEDLCAFLNQKLKND